MTRIALIAALTTALAAPAFATGTTPVNANQTFDTTQVATQAGETATVRVTLSTKSKPKNEGSKYHYANPLGVGPHNDSR